MKLSSLQKVRANLLQKSFIGLAHGANVKELYGRNLFVFISCRNSYNKYKFYSCSNTQAFYRKVLIR